MSTEPHRNVILERFVRRLKVLGGVVAVLALILIAVYFLVPRWLVQGAIAYQTWRDGLDRHSVQVGDTRWVYYSGGKQGGPPLVLVHGYGGSHADWLLAAPYLMRNFHVIVPDLPGWGDSTRHAGADYGYAAQVERLHGFLDALDTGRVVLAGHSMGGAIAGLYAARYPRDVGVLVLIDAAGVRFKDNAFVGELESGKNPFAVDNRAGFRHLESMLFADPPWLPPRIEDVFIQRSRDNHAFRSKVLDEITQPDTRYALQPKLADITAPTLAIWCTRDQIIDVSALDVIRNGLTRVPSIGVTKLLGCGHMSIMEKPRAVADAITHFVLVP